MFTNFIPNIWTYSILEQLINNSVMFNLVSRKYEKETKDGNKILIYDFDSDIDINDYVRDAALTIQTLSGGKLELNIDQEKYFAFMVDDVDSVQSRPDIMTGYTSKAGKSLKRYMDNFILSFYIDADPSNTSGSDLTPLALTKDTVYDAFVDFDTKLSNNNVPSEGRWVVVRPHTTGLMKKSKQMTNMDKKFNTEVLRHAYVGDFAGFSVHVTTNIDVVAGAPDRYNVIAGVPGSIDFVAQIEKLEASRPHNYFSDLMKGLFVYGGKVFNPKILGRMIIENN